MDCDLQAILCADFLAQMLGRNKDGGFLALKERLRETEKRQFFDRDWGWANAEGMNIPAPKEMDTDW